MRVKNFKYYGARIIFMIFEDQPKEFMTGNARKRHLSKREEIARTARYNQRVLEEIARAEAREYGLKN